MGRLLLRLLPLAVVVAAPLGTVAPPAVSAPRASLTAASSAVSTAVVHPRDGGFVVLHPGAVTTLRLSVCGTCGYALRVTQKPNPSVVDYRKRSNVYAPGCTGCVGGNTQVDFVMAGRALGQTGVTFSFFAPGVPDRPARQVRVALAVLRTPRIAGDGTVQRVRAGDTLYGLARADLSRHASLTLVSRLARRFYRDNAAVIGADPDVLVPGEVLLLDDSGIAGWIRAAG